MNAKFPVYYVEFLDHCSHSEWLNKEELDDSKAIKVYLVGWLVGEDENSYKFSLEVTEDGNFGDTICVLKGSIVSKKKLKVKLS